MENQGDKKSGFVKVGECLYRYKSGTYYGLVKVKGKQVRRSLRTASLTAAKFNLRQFKGQVARMTGGGTGIRFEECVQKWLANIKTDVKPTTHYWYSSICKQLEPFFRGVAVRKIGKEEMETYKIKSHAVKPRNYNARLKVLRAIFDYAIDVQRIIIENPANDLTKKREIKTEVVPPTREQFLALVLHLRESPRTLPASRLVEFLGYSGMRIGEAVAVCWKDIDFDSKRLLVRGGVNSTKNSEELNIPLFPPLVELLKRIQTERGTTNAADKIFRFSSIKTALRGACKDLKWDKTFSHHDFRHFFCSNAIEQNVPIKTIAGWLRHKDGGVLVSKTYGHLRDEFSNQMAAKMTFSVGSPTNSGGSLSSGEALSE